MINISVCLFSSFFCVMMMRRWNFKLWFIFQIFNHKLFNKRCSLVFTKLVALQHLCSFFQSQHLMTVLWATIGAFHRPLKHSHKDFPLLSISPLIIFISRAFFLKRMHAYSFLLLCSVHFLSVQRCTNQPSAQPSQTRCLSSVALSIRLYSVCLSFLRSVLKPSRCRKQCEVNHCL